MNSAFTLPESIADVVPHGGHMLLLDRLVSFDERTVVTELTVRADGPFVRDARVGAWVGLEYMAQSIAAFAGCQARSRNEPPKIGFLIGSRNYTCSATHFPVGCTLRVAVTCQLQDEGGLGSFTATISGDDIAANATLAVFQPNNAEEFLRQTGSGSDNATGPIA